MKRSPDYESIASQFDRRYRDGNWSGVQAVVRAARPAGDSARALEVGCGTGYWLGALSPTLGAFGLDPSPEMLRLARLRAPIADLVQARAENLPFAPGSFQLVFCVNALHHFPDPRRFPTDSRRILRSGGHLLVIGADVHDPGIEWYVYDFFARVKEMDRRRYPRWATLERWIEAAGLHIEERGIAQRIRERFAGEEVFDDPFLGRGATSQLGLISQSEYRAGMAQLRSAAGREAQPTFEVRINLRYLLATLPVKD